MRTDTSGRAVQIGRFVGSPVVLALGITSANVQLNPLRWYRLWGSVDAFFKFGPAGVTAATTDHPTTAKISDLHQTDDTNFFIAGIVATGTGSLFISEIDPSGV